MRYLPAIAGALLGLLFLFASLAYFFKLFDVPPDPAGSPAALFKDALYPTGYFDFVKTCELIGAILIAIPKTRRLGLLVLGPIIVNIRAFHGFIKHGEGLFNPMIILIVALALFLVWAERRAFAAYIRGGAPA
jgi:putative oxidoreductase